jgi:hypothetical protein
MDLTIRRPSGHEMFIIESYRLKPEGAVLDAIEILGTAAALATLIVVTDRRAGSG